MPHKNQSKQPGADTREPDDLEEGARSARVAAKSRRPHEDEDDEDEIDDDDIVATVDLDAAPEGDGPDA